MVSPDTMSAVITVESAYNPFAIGVVGGRLERQPKNINEAIATATMLEKNGWNYSVGIAQINKKNFKKYGLTIETAFENCKNINTGAKILQDCYRNSLTTVKGSKDQHLARAFSCYYSGRFDSRAGYGYAKKVFKAGQLPIKFAKE